MDVDIQTGDFSLDDIKKLVARLERVRGERDNYRSKSEAQERDLDFLKAESQFTIKSLRAQLHKHSQHNSPSASSSRTTITHLQRTALVSVIVAQRCDAERQLYATRLDTAARALEQAKAKSKEAESLAKEREATLHKVHCEDVEMRDSLASTEYKLATLESRNADLTALIARYKEELDLSHKNEEELSDALAHSEDRLGETMKQLEETESQRNSLALQITHLEQDLNTAKEEVAEVETRYSTLQSKQLAAMSSSEQLRTLRQQIEGQEQRILRRTEQIGIHQHDIKRLETNLKLQEERVMEMTNELETAEAEKLAMIEDCRTTREERDEALRRCERLEESAENLEETLQAMDRQRESEVAAVVRVAVGACAKRRQISSSFSRTVARCDARIVKLSHQLRDARQDTIASLSSVEHVSSSHQTAMAELRNIECQLHDSELLRADVGQQMTSATTALATVLTDFRQLGSVSQLRKEYVLSLQAELAEVKQQFETHLHEFAALQARHETLLSHRTEQESNVQTMQERYDSLQQSLDTLQQERDQALAHLSHAQDELHAHLSESSARAQEESSLRAQLDEVRVKFEQEASGLRTQLTRTAEQLEDARLERANLESAHRQVLEDLNASKDELQQSLETALHEIERTKGIEDEFKLAEGRRSAQVDSLREEVEGVKRALEEASKNYDDLLVEHASNVTELEERRRELADIEQAKEQLQDELQTLRLQHSADAASLRQRLDDATAQNVLSQQALDELQTRYDESIQQRHELEDSLVAADAALEGTKLDLKAAIERHTHDATEHQVQLDAAHEKLQAAEASRSHLEAEIEAVQQRLHETEEALNDVQRQKDEVQAHATALQADIQRSLSLQRSKDITIKDRYVPSFGHTTIVLTASFSEQEIGELQEKLNAARADYGRSEQDAKSAEMQLTLQAIKHKEVVESLNSQLVKLQANSELQETVLELQEKNEDLCSTFPLTALPLVG
ncbi:hypothetical protein BC835DRAFT_1318137 [Cytidiella melzeri]|nr:hypothetical protein BC835DRAFT_1318137 [Cytidiella melzeri]